MLKDEQKSAKTLPQRFAGLNKERGAWGENLACGVARQSVLLGRNGAWQGVVNLATHNTANSAWQVLVGKTAHGYTANSAWQAWRKWAMLAGEADKAKMERCLGGGLLSLSLSLSLSLVACTCGTPLG